MLISAKQDLQRLQEQLQQAQKKIEYLEQALAQVPPEEWGENWDVRVLGDVRIWVRGNNHHAQMATSLLRWVGNGVAVFWDHEPYIPAEEIYMPTQS